MGYMASKSKKNGISYTQRLSRPGVFCFNEEDMLTFAVLYEWILPTIFYVAYKKRMMLITICVFVPFYWFSCRHSLQCCWISLMYVELWLLHYIASFLLAWRERESARARENVSISVFIDFYIASFSLWYCNEFNKRYRHRNAIEYIAWIVLNTRTLQ